MVDGFSLMATDCWSRVTGYWLLAVSENKNLNT
jgi:hypothetical protein